MENDAKKYYGEKFMWISKIFYSPTRNSCMYIVKFDYPKSATDITPDLDFNVFDFYTKESLGVPTPSTMQDIE